MSELTVEERVAAGAAWLDDRLPHWPLLVDLNRLDLSDSCACILGQTFGDYGRAPIIGKGSMSREEYATELGFQAGSDWRDYDDLGVEWKRLILARREVGRD